MKTMLMGSVPAGVVFAMAAADDDKIVELRTQAEELAAASEGIINAADEEGRDLTDEEVEEIEGNGKKVAALHRQIAAREAIRPQGQGRRSAPEPRQPGNRQAVPAEARSSDPRAGFRHLGEFASCVRAASMRDESAVGRLRASMNEGVGEDGGFLVPPEFRDGIMKVVEGEESLLSRCDTSTTARNSVMHPKDETTPWGSSGIQAYWEGEGAAADASKAKFQGDSLRLNKLFARVDVTDELLEDAPQLDSYLRVKAPEVMTSVINLAIIQGNGVGKPLGFMKSGALVTVSKESSQPADTVHHRNIVKMWARMYAPCRRNAVWLINQDVEPQLDLMSFKDATDSPVPVYLPAGTIAGQGYSTLKGRPVIPVQGMETLGDLGDIALVDLTKYRALTKAGGTRVDTSIHLKFDTDETVFRFIFRLAGAPWWSAPISPRDGSNTLSPFVTLESR
jgi:HK97 family phage major capsid protein